MEGSTARLNVATLPQEIEILQLVPVEVSGDVDALGSYNHNLNVEL